jgi:glycosyltransferase involved in cell wall biosynthesis
MTNEIPPQAGATARDTIVVVPCYNEAKRLDTNAVLHLVDTEPRVSLLFVDDGSIDATARILEELCRSRPESITCFALAVNSGKTEAVRRGVVAALERRPSFVAYWDADLSTPLDMVPVFLAELDRNPNLLGVLGSRVRRLGADIDRLALRHYAGRIFATLASAVLGMAVYDTQCGAKMFRASEDLARAFAEPFQTRWILDVEMLARLRRDLGAKALASRLTEVPLPRWRDVAGSKLTMTQGAAAFIDLWRIWRTTR